MALILRATRDKVTFEWEDEEVFTSVTIKSDETDEAMIRKLKRVIALVEGHDALPVRDPVPPSLPTPYRPPVDTSTNGWAAPVSAPELPEDRQADYEIIRPGEDV
ncbi:hypothetical protein [Streptomyces paludis]|uniref:Uncharacterized protein n=1 Tax=Streptomyces paludis TaxID=2282738 RepID=A0A345HWR2_9ACTN|nr:hypothetical protein [Streptomyces paludis]AXG81136.1 hypothetical protein DVK44_29485 [Streptomyces paludis]